MTVKTTEEFISRLKKIGDPSAMIVTIHLFCEHALNELMKVKKRNPGKFITDNSSFVVKLDLCYNMNLINQELFENLVKLNRLRNKCAHTLNVNFSKIDHNYNTFDIPGVDIESATPTTNKIVQIGMVTYVLLHNLLNQMGIKV